MLEKIENGLHVFIDWKLRLQYIMKNQYLESDRCDLALGSEEFFEEQLGMIVSRDTPYIQIINNEYLLIIYKLIYIKYAILELKKCIKWA